MAELGKYTKAIRNAGFGRQTAQSVDANVERRRSRSLVAKKRALEILRRTDLSCSKEAKGRHNRWLAAKRRAIEVLYKTRNA